jgi:pimeloyl-ACP methyl ester carboxylesterase
MRAVLLALLLLVGCAAPEPVERRAGPAGAVQGEWGQQDHFLPVRDAGGAERLIVARFCRPPGQGVRRLVVINHGKSPFAAQRAAMVPPGCGAEHVRWFLERGFAVLLPVRRGYGASGGTMAEGYPACAAPRDYVAGALEAARDIRAAIAYGTALPGVAGERVVVVGQSAGGLGTIALSSLNDARVGGLVNMAGGDGGRLNQVANNVCQPAALVAAAGQFGAVARAPMLWVYTANDSYFGPELAAAMHRAYVGAGGRAELRALPAWGRDGHILFGARGGSAVWGPELERFLGLARRVAAGSVLARPR